MTATLRARPHLHYAPVPGGVYVSGARTQFVMRGAAVLFTVADTCVPLLERGTTEDDLVTALGSEKARPAVRHFVGRLDEHGMLLDLDRLTVAAPPAGARALHGEALAHLESVSDDPYAVFARLRSAVVRLAGPPEVVGPAARGLTRAGVGTVLTDLADELPSSLGPSGREREDSVDAVLSAGPLDVVPTDAGVPVLPLVVDDHAIVVGPVRPTHGDPGAWAAFVDRALAWARAENPTPVSRPAAGALAGALAGQHLFELLAGLAEDGVAHVVHGADLTADRVVVDTWGAAEESVRSLEDARAVPLPEAEEAVASAAALTGRWTGLFAATTGEDLPQMPLALRDLQPRDGGSGAVLAWAAEQETAAVGAMLEALRRRATRDPYTSTGAAGLTEEHWLLDGALRLLAADAEPWDDIAPLDRDGVAALDREAHRRWQSLERLTTRPFTVRFDHVPGIDWRLGRVEVAGSGEVLGMGWGADAAEAAREALGTALTTAQLPWAIGALAALRTDALLFADGSTTGTLGKQVTAYAAARDRTFRGRTGRADPVLGELPFWCGPVEALPQDRETADAR